ncbi:MAG: hypothetical protein BMS9Abin15_0360 [Gammaproteobacteria bacterium]|nr:MAG: hypothetical protein BMS9Abin15_0360 [Gammaproteobacteria bacterium]
MTRHLIFSLGTGLLLAALYTPASHAAAGASEWLCVPAADGRGWDCNKDGVPAVRPEPKPKPHAAVPAPASEETPPDIVVTPVPEAPLHIPKALPETPIPPPAAKATPPPSLAKEPPLEEQAPAVAAEPARRDISPEPEPEPAPMVAEEEQAPTVAAEPAHPEPEPEPAPVVAEEIPLLKPTAEPVAKPEPTPEPAPEATPTPVMAEPDIQPAPQAMPVVAEPEPPPLKVTEPPARFTEPQIPPPSEITPEEDAKETVAREHTPAIDAPAGKPAAKTPLLVQRSTPASRAFCLNPPPIPPKRADQPGFIARDNAPIDIQADNLEKRAEETILKGNVEIERADQRLFADTVRINRQTNIIEATGNLRYTDDDMNLSASAGRIDTSDNNFEFSDAAFQNYSPFARGTASRINSPSRNVVELENAQYTTCAPGDQSWLITADRITLDKNTGRGVAKNGKVIFKNIPILYAPTLTFPIDDRRLSGFLAPNFGRSNKRGIEFATPYYFNIAPNRDATLTPRLMSKRGLKLDGEFRYLYPGHRGEWAAAILPDDRDADDNRWAYNLRQNSTLFKDWLLNVQLSRVSDDEYFEDFGNSLSIASRTHVESRLGLSHKASWWQVSGLVQQYQTVDKTIASFDKPYKREPQLAFSAWTPKLFHGLNARVDTEYVKFDRENVISTKLLDLYTGDRIDIYPSVSMPIRKAGYFLTPKLGARYTRYKLDNPLPLAENSIDRTLPVFSLDGGLFFERDTNWFGNSMVQTLEPRAYYLRIPERSQSKIPVFDTGLSDFRESFLFRENRFSGIDRINDANQLSLGVTSRVLKADTGDEWLSLTFGQIYYFRDQKVTLPGDLPENTDTSPIIMEASLRPSRNWNTTAGLQWDPDSGNTQKSTLSLHYQPEKDRILNASYRYRRDTLEQTDLSVLWPITKQWHFAGRWNYSLRDSETFEAFAGLEYQSCCWATRIVGRSYINQVGGNRNNAIFIELELKGLGSIGNKVENFLEKGILGYERYRE